MTLSRIRKCNFFFKLSKAYKVKFIENIKRKYEYENGAVFFPFFLCKKTLRRYFFPIFNNKRQNWKHVRGYYIIGRLNNQGIYFFFWNEGVSLIYSEFDIYE